MFGLMRDVLAVGVPPRLRVHLRVDVNVFRLTEIVESLGPELSASSGGLHPSEWRSFVIRERIVEPDGSGLDLFHRFEHVVEASRVDVSAEAVLACVRALDRFV